jgi:sensor histidine kinase YesM
MDKIELQISNKDWIYITTIGAFFGFFFSLFLYFINEDLKDFSTILLGTFSSINIAIFSSFFITISNNYILPKVNKKFWYLISFGFSFLSGAAGFLLSFSIFYLLDFYIAILIEPYSIYITVIVGFLTFLIGLILHQFISMKYKNESIKNELLESKLKVFENELNPHFLFNALNSMSELVYIDQKKAEESILNLSKFLRNVITKDGLISIESELSMVKTYVDIENIRFENNIVLNIDLDEGLKDILIPKFSIQLLVENGIKHGYIRDRLNIDIIIKNGMIKVSNDGKKLESLTYGKGLTNLKRRLELLKVGDFLHNIKEKKVEFIIILKDEK